MSARRTKAKRRAARYRWWLRIELASGRYTCICCDVPTAPGELWCAGCDDAILQHHAKIEADRAARGVRKCPECIFPGEECSICDGAGEVPQ